MKNPRFELHLDPEQAHLTAPSFGARKWPLEVATTRHLVLDLAKLVKSTVGPVIIESQDADPKYPSFLASIPGDKVLSVNAERCVEQILKATQVKEMPVAPTDAVPDLGPAVPESAHAEPLPTGVAKLHKRLNNDLELHKLHVKHYHMSGRQFRLRTSELALPKEIYDRFDRIVQKCKVCRDNAPPPQRSR